MTLSWTQQVEWTRRHFESIKIGGTWAIPRSAMILKKVSDKEWQLHLLMPWTPEMGRAAKNGADVPATEQALRAFQRKDFEDINQRCVAAGIEMTDPKGLLL